MNRIEIIGLFSALEMLGEDKNYDGIMKIIKKVLREAENKTDKAERDE